MCNAPLNCIMSNTSVGVGEVFWISFGIYAKRNLKGKRQLENGPECMMGEEFKESKSAMEKRTKGGKRL
jgi:hypothetical protein